MGNINLPCNMEPEEAKNYLKAFQPYLDEEEERQASGTFRQYLFYETWGRNDFRECTCTGAECGNFEITKEENREFFREHHGDYVTCPRCGRTVQLIALGRMRSFATLKQTNRMVICRVGPNGSLLLTAGWGTKKYSWHDLQPTVDFVEKARICLLPGKRMEWRKAREWNGWMYRTANWYREDYVKEPFTPYMYQSDGSYFFLCPERVLETDMRYATLWDWCSEETQVDLMEDNIRNPVRQVVKYLSAYSQYPAMEMAEKIGFHDAVSDLVLINRKNHRYLDWNANSLQGFMRLPKPEARKLVKSGCGLVELKIYRETKKNGTIHSMDDFTGLLGEIGGAGNMPLLSECARKCGVDLKKAAAYVKKQEKKSLYETMTFWRDYLQMAAQLEYDLTRPDVLMPKNLKERHDAAAATIKAEKDAREQEAYRKRKKNLKKLYEFELDGLMIQVPESAQEIVDEGKALKHCVGGYAARHIQGKLDILFLRSAEEPDKPMVTIEMEARTFEVDAVHMVQIHGYRNECYDGAVSPRVAYRDFLDTWMRWLKAGSKRDRKGAPLLARRKEKTA